MTNVLTLISNIKEAAISSEVKDKYVKLLNATSSNWLSNNVALDLFFEGDLDENIKLSLKKEMFDHAVQKTATRRKKLLLADMDSTIIQCECIDELADFMGIKNKVSHITESAMRGEIDFKAALKERVALLKGLKMKDLDTVFKERVALTPGAKTLVLTMNANGANTVLVSGGFTYFTERVSELTGFRVNRANILLHKNGELTGQVGEPIVDSNTKINSLIEFRSNANLSIHDTIAVGDGANDIPMLLGAGLGVGYNPFPTAGEAADVILNHGDLTALLYIQGYTDKEFIT